MPRPARLPVVINAETADVPAELTGRDQVTVTEAVRRLIGYGAVVYRAVVQGRQVVLRGGGRGDDRVVLLDPPRGHPDRGPARHGTDSCTEH